MERTGRTRISNGTETSLTKKLNLTSPNFVTTDNDNKHGDAYYSLDHAAQSVSKSPSRKPIDIFLIFQG